MGVDSNVKRFLMDKKLQIVHKCKTKNLKKLGAEGRMLEIERETHFLKTYIELVKNILFQS